MKWNTIVISIILLIAAFLIMGFSVFISSQRNLSSLENTLLQLFSLFFGLIGSYIIGRHSASNATKEMITPHARSAFRRLISLYKSLSRVVNVIENSENSNNNHIPSITIATLEAIVIEQLATADDALEDWNDIVPDQVAELRRKLDESRNSRS